MDDFEQNEVVFPSVIFRIKNGLYCINSKYIESLIQRPESVEVPEAPPYMTGIFPYRGTFITMFDLRTAFGMKSLPSEFEDFDSMLETRKQDHKNWVSELTRTAKEGDDFKLATDPHLCAFGKWYYSFKSDNNIVNAHMRKIEAPHQSLHEAAREIEKLKKIEDPEEREKKIEKILSQVKGKYMPEVLSLLDDTKDTFKDTLFREMVIVLSDARLGLVVDEVLMVDDLVPTDEENVISDLQGSEFVLGVRKSEKIDDIILEIDIPKILGY